MDLHKFLLVVFVCLILLIFIFVSFTLYDFYSLDFMLFRKYLIGLFFYFLTIFCFFLRYVVLTPLNPYENVILAYGLTISPLIGVFFFIIGTEYLANQLNKNFKKDEKRYKVFLIILLVLCVYEIFDQLKAETLKDFYVPLTIVGNILYIITLLLAVNLLLDFQKALGGIFSKIIFHYIVAVVLLVVGGLISVEALVPVTLEEKVFTDLSYIRNVFAILGCLIAVIPFVICYKSVSKFKKLLTS